MSRRVLSYAGVKRQHTLQDDMESLLYVVLYCAFLHLPHDLSKDELAQKIWELFEFSEWIEGRRTGGLGKMENAITQRLTKSMAFNPALKQWIKTVIEYCEPPRRLQRGDIDKWGNPDYLDRFWTDFLEANELPTNDRYFHDHPHVTDKYKAPDAAGHQSVSETVSLGEPLSDKPIREAILLDKRPLNEPEVDGASASKRKKLPCLAAGSQSNLPLRNSPRLQGQQDSPNPQPSWSRSKRSVASDKVWRGGVGTRATGRAPRRK